MLRSLALPLVLCPESQGLHTTCLLFGEMLHSPSARISGPVPAVAVLSERCVILGLYWSISQTPLRYTAPRGVHQAGLRSSWQMQVTLKERPTSLGPPGAVASAVLGVCLKPWGSVHAFKRFLSSQPFPDRQSVSRHLLLRILAHKHHQRKQTQSTAQELSGKVSIPSICW